MSSIIHMYAGHVPSYQSSWRLGESDGEMVSAHRVRMVQPADNSFCVAMDDFAQTANFQESSVSNLKIAPMPKRTEANRDEPMFITAMSVGVTDDGDPVLFCVPPITLPCDGNWALKCAGVNVGRPLRLAEEVSDE
jgi:hypothetical protein